MDFLHDGHYYPNITDLMSLLTSLAWYASLLPLLLYGLCGLSLSPRRVSAAQAWLRCRLCLHVAWLAALIAAPAVWLHPLGGTLTPWPGMPLLTIDRLAASMLLLITILGAVIGVFSARYLQGEPDQVRYVRQLCGVLACVQCVLLANHWLVLIAAWASSGFFLRGLLCFYAERPFARLAVQKKSLADRAADILLILCALLVWLETGSAYFDGLTTTALQTSNTQLDLAACCLVLAVVIRTALMPVHGWLTQVMEAPTPVSALLHAGVVNLGGYVFINLAPLLNVSQPARWLLLGFGLLSTVLAALVMLTRISIKVKLAWSTIAQMGFMLLECALGLYTLAALHLLGHSLYKSYAFLSASSVVQSTQQHIFYPAPRYWSSSLWLAPFVTALLVLPLLQGVAYSSGLSALPVWWGLVLVFAWSPLLWLNRSQQTAWSPGWQFASAVLLLVILSCLVAWGHAIALGIHDLPFVAGGWISALAMAGMYTTMALVQGQPHKLENLRRWVYAGFYLDEFMTRLTLRFYPGEWAATTHAATRAWTSLRNKP